MENQFQIKVSRGVAKYLLYTFGPQPIQIKRNTIVYAGSETPILPPTKAMKDVGVIFETNDQALAGELSEDSVRKKISQIFTFCFHQALFSWVKAQTSMGSSIRDAIRNFFSEMGIEEDDYSLDTAYRLVQDRGGIHRKREYHLTDQDRKIIQVFFSVEDLSERLGISESTAYLHLNSGNLYKERYYLITA